MTRRHLIVVLLPSALGAVVSGNRHAPRIGRGVCAAGRRGDERCAGESTARERAKARHTRAPGCAAGDEYATGSDDREAVAATVYRQEALAAMQLPPAA